MKAKPVKEKRPPQEKQQFTVESLPPLLTYRHVMYICSCSAPTAYEIMKQAHRIVWPHGNKVRLLKEPFLEQIANECKRVSA